jgi:predicted esterase YcpF (UPF0227 family)
MEYHGYIQNKITSLVLIDKNSNNFYNYKDINFFSKLKNKNTNLVVFFHGLVSNINERDCSFRGFDYEIENTDIICVSDRLLYMYKNDIEVCWFMSSDKYNINDNYVELFDHLINKKSYDKVIFTGTSEGGYPSLYFSSYYKQIALISNAQIYPEKYNHYHKLIETLESHGDKLLYENKSIENIILKKQPRKIYLYNNLNDTGLIYVKDAYYEPFVKFIKNNKLYNILELKLFYGIYPFDNQNDNDICFPENESYLSVLKRTLLEDID